MQIEVPFRSWCWRLYRIEYSRNPLKLLLWIQDMRTKTKPWAQFLVSSAKVFVRKIDAVFFKSRLTKRYSRKLTLKVRQESDSLFQNAMWINYHQTINPIPSLCDLYGSDKGSMIPFDSTEFWATHNYADLYHHLSSRFRYSVKNVFECGIGSADPLIPYHFKLNGIPGASLRVWRECFLKQIFRNM